MIYSPRVVFYRDDDTRVAALQKPVVVDVVTSAAVNAGVVIRDMERCDTKQLIRDVMHERMARILYLFEQNRVEHLVLGSFGTGVFKNEVTMVGERWKELIQPGGRFCRSFRRITFAVIGTSTYQQFKGVLGPLER
jgi:uncharacterized protein (TIGR02452 family)